jgi:thiamine-phosphate pyrophosphorylase
MASQRKPAEPRRLAPRLYLVATLAGDPGGLAQDLAVALAAGDIAAVLLRLPEADERTLLTHIQALAPRAQESGTALLLDGRPDLVSRAGADGAHLPGLEALTTAVPALKPDRIAGCGGIHSRHDAMLAAETGADYVMFGEPDAAGQRPSFDAVVERVAWWAEVFEIPCVGYAGSLDEVGTLSAAGADFVAVGDCIFADARGVAAAVRDAMTRLTVAESVG